MTYSVTNCAFMEYNGITVLDIKSKLQRKKEGGVVDNTEDSKVKCLRNVEQTGL